MPGDLELFGSTIAGRYRIDSLVGRGGLCAVYRADDTRDHKRVAVKILPAEQAAAPEMARRFQREATTGKRIQHENVVAVTDSGALPDGALFLVMELLDGRPLSSVLEGGRRIAAPRALAIARQILTGLGAAHKMGITHRDVKPENVFLVGEPGAERVKLLDFGIASNERAALKLTAAGVAFGTPEYISPEMAMGLETDPRADLYSVGVVLFQMVTGRLPFLSKELKELLHAHAEEAPPSLRAVAPEARVLPEVEALVLRAMQKVPSDRFDSAEAMIAAIDALGPRRRRWPLAAAAVVALAALAGGAWWWTQRAPEPSSATGDERAAAIAALEGGKTCLERKAALEKLAVLHDPSLLPVLKRAQARGHVNGCMLRELRAAVADVEKPR